MNGRQLRHRGAVAAAIFLAAVGAALGNGRLLLAAALPLAYVVAGSLSSVDGDAALVAERRVAPQPARPGELVTVELAVRNDGDRTLTDVRVADAVPEALAVLEGTARAGGTLRPGEELTVRYQLSARRGEHDFEPPQVRVRGLGGGAVATRRPLVEGVATLVCRLDADAPPLAEHGRHRVGTLSTDEPGEGLSFHSVREHRDDDPAHRIDWRHYAKRGELATVNYERDVSATVVVVLDARVGAHVVAGPGRPTAAELGGYAATRALTDLLASGHEVGVAVIGVDGPGPAGLHWLPPAKGAQQRSLALAAFRTALDERPDATAPERATPDEQVRELLALVPTGAQVSLFTPLLDDVPVGAVQRFRAADLPVSVLSPDVVPENTVGGQLTQVRRRSRLVACQNAGARAFDWRRGTPLPLIIDRAFAAEARVGAPGGGR